MAFPTMTHLQDYIAAIIAVHTIALVFVNLTPTPKDNQRLAGIAAIAVKLYRGVEILAGVITPLVKK